MTNQNVPRHSLDLVARTDDTAAYPTSGVQFSVLGPDGSHHVYVDLDWVLSGKCFRDGSHLDGRIQRRDITITYGEWVDHHG